MSLEEKKSTTIVGLICAAAITLVVGSAQAQIQSTPYSTKGKVIEAKPGLITIRDANGKKVLINILKPGEESVTIKDKGKSVGVMGISLDLSITAHLTPSQIAKGRVLQFNTYLDDKGRSKGTVAKISILDPEQAGRPGVFEDGEDDNGPAGTKPYLVKGRATGTVKRGKLTVTVGKCKAAPKGKITIVVTDETSITAYSEKIEHVQPGDDIEIEGSRFTSAIIGTKIVVVRNPGGAKAKPTDNAKGGKKPADNKDGDKKGASKGGDDDSDKADGGDKGKVSDRVLIIN